MRKFWHIFFLYLLDCNLMMKKNALYSNNLYIIKIEPWHTFAKKKKKKLINLSFHQNSKLFYLNENLAKREHNNFFSKILTNAFII